MKTRSAPLALTLFFAVYCFAIFPWAFFRHDDWLILGNAVNRLPQDWGFLWRATLYFHGIEGDWFFRPFFKLGTYVFFQLFHFHYYGWLVTLLGCQVAAIALAYATLRQVGASERRATLFVVLFTASAHFHFASLVWMGEGMMNSPQLLLMALATYAFARATLGWQFLSALAFALSLGFKESSLVLPALFFGLTLAAVPFRDESWARRIARLAPCALIAGGYLAWRFVCTPFNGSYVPHEWSDVLRSVVLIVGAVLAPLAIAALLGGLRDRPHWRGSWTALRALWPYAPFLFLMVAPYFGHPFFSPGWLLLPGFYFLFIACLAEWPASSTKTLWPVGLAVLAVTAAPVLWQTSQLGWWQWRIAQRTFLERMQQADPQTIKLVHICEVPNPRYPTTDVLRVVGFRDGMEDLWELLHHTRVQVMFGPCNDERAPASADRLAFEFQFPELRVQ